MGLVFFTRFLLTLFFYYVDIASDVIVSIDFMSDDRYFYYGSYYFGVSVSAIGMGMIASAFFSYDLVFYRYRRYHIIPRIILSFLHITPILLFIQYLKLCCCHEDDTPNNLIQLTSIDNNSINDSSNDNNNNNNNKKRKIGVKSIKNIKSLKNGKNSLNSDHTEQLTGPSNNDNDNNHNGNGNDNNISVVNNNGNGNNNNNTRIRVTSSINIQSGINVPQTLEERREELERLINNDMKRVKLIDAYFHSPIQVCLQIYILGNFLLKSDDTRKFSINDYPKSLSENPMEFYKLFFALFWSLMSLSYAAYSRISPMINDENYDVRCKVFVKLLFIFRAFLETLLRSIRFMIVSVVLSASFGGLSIMLEVIWKFFIISCAMPKQKKEDEDNNDNGNGNNNENEDMLDREKERELSKKKGKENLRAVLFKMYSIATWMIFSHERTRRFRWLMRILDMYVWTGILLGLTYIIAVDTYNVVVPNFRKGICEGFQKDCVPIELVFVIFTLWALLLMIYCFSPSIFSILDEISIYSQGQSNAIVGAGMDIDYHMRKGGILSKNKKNNHAGVHPINNNNSNNNNLTFVGNAPKGYAPDVPYDSEEDDYEDPNYINPDADAQNPSLMENKIKARQQRVQARQERKDSERRRSSTANALQSIDDIEQDDNINDDQRLQYYSKTSNMIDSQFSTLNTLYSS